MARQSAQLTEARHQLAGSKTDLEALPARLDQAASDRDQLQSQLTDLQAELTKVKASKVKTVVETKTVTKYEPKWVPNGAGISVETVGYRGLIEIHDVHITHTYGFTSVVGIAVNVSGPPAGYVELGCSLKDSSGKVLANGIDNKTDWPPGASWGFECADQVNATGAILRVDEFD